MDKSNLTRNVWSKDSYYRVAEEGSLDFEHPAMKKLVEIARHARIILDMGCGEGTRLNKLLTLLPKSFPVARKGYGIDISPKAINIARKKYPKLNFAVGDLEKLPYKNSSFDLVYSAYVFEHLDNPDRVLGEGIRVLAEGGSLVIIAPNFGSPNRASPPFRGNRNFKLMKGFLRDFFPERGLNWKKVKPIATDRKYEIDWDTTIEPYLGTLISYLKGEGLTITYHSSSWERDASTANFLQKKFKLLGKANIYPFNLWGPHLIVVAKKI